jgi:hypothetical protein
MNKHKTKAWLLSAAMAAGIASLAPTTSLFAAERDREEWVKYEDVPRAVRSTLDEQRGRRDIKRIDHVWRDGREFYRATINDKGTGDTIIRVSDTGKVLSSEQANDRDSRGERRDEETQVKYNSLPDRVKEVVDRERGNRDVKAIYRVNRGDQTFYRAVIDERNGDRMIRVSEGGRLLSEEDIRDARTAGGTVRRGVEDDGDRVAFDRLPGEVKAAIGREAGGGRVEDVYRYQRRGSTIYEADVPAPGGRTHVVRVNQDGRLLSERDDAPEGRRSVRFDELPGPVKDAIGRDANRNQINRVVQITQGGKTYYRAQVQEGRDRDPSWITVDENGRRVNDFDRR